MFVNQDLCVGCGLCVPYCPVGAITVTNRKAEIDRDVCVECGCCERSGVCCKKALTTEKLTMPRGIRSTMSDVFTVFEDTGVSGRGTEEMKTNDVTGRFKPGWIGMAVEVGRPVAAGTFRQVQEIAVALAETGLVEFEVCNPITKMMKDNKTGYFREDILDEQAVLDSTVESATTHCVFDDEDKAVEFMKAIKEEDLGMSVVVSGLFDMVGECCKKSGLTPHTIEYSLGIWGNTKKLPEEPIMEINTMCGHGMVSVGRIKDIIRKIEAGRMTCEEGGKELGKTCTCGIFNWKRAGEILQRITGKE